MAGITCVDFCSRVKLIRKILLELEKRIEKNYDENKIILGFIRWKSKIEVTNFLWMRERKTERGASCIL